jgi:hypothetical protein
LNHVKKEEETMVQLRRSVLLLIAIFVSAAGFSGKPKTHERWGIKTSYAQPTNNPQTIDIKVLMRLKAPVKSLHLDVHNFYDKFIPGTYSGFKEGAFVKTTGWLHLAAYSTDDDDYHLQINDSKTNLKTCAIIEIPDPVNTHDASVKEHWKQGREFVDSVLGVKSPPKEPKHLLSKPVQVEVTGQLFYDLSHTNPGSRGKAKMKATSSWEIHPVWTIGLVNN